MLFKLIQMIQVLCNQLLHALLACDIIHKHLWDIPLGYIYELVHLYFSDGPVGSNSTNIKQECEAFQLSETLSIDLSYMYIGVTSYLIFTLLTDRVS